MKGQRTTRRLIAAALWVAVTGIGVQLARVPAQAQGRGAGGGRSSQEGAELFATTCQICHGEAGVGNSAPSLHGTKFTSGYVRQAMSEGRPGTMMPRFTGVFTTREIDAVAQYVASLQNAPRPSEAVLRGDPAAGEMAFFRPQRAHSCYVCHSVNGRGGRVGPDLAQKAASKPARELFEKIVLAPHRLKDGAYAPSRLTTKLEVLTGIKAGETKDVVRFYDARSLPPVLRTINKSDVVSLTTVPGSVMPADYASRFTLKELLDIVAFVKSTGSGSDIQVTFQDVFPRQ